MIDIYCDGSAVNSKDELNIGTWAFIVIQDNKIIYEKVGYDNKAKNGKMELCGLLNSLKYIHLSGYTDEVTIYCDSQYVVNGYNSWIWGWVKNNFKNGKVKYINEWKEVFKLKDKKIKAKWVKGHNGNIYNERVDYLASTYRKKLNKK